MSRWNPQPAVERALARVEVGDCWLWQGSPDSSGYGQIRNEAGVLVMVHRLIYEHLVGTIPAGLQLDHHCRMHHCCNPDHLEPVTPKENHRRGMQVRAAACKYGHPFDGHNGKQRTCSACARRRLAKFRAKQT
jgi:hypothetical protein